MKDRKEFDLSVYGGRWRVVVWSYIENRKQVHGGMAVLLQTFDRSKSWIFDDMGEAFAFCFDHGFVPVDESGGWEDSGDLNAGMGEAEPVPLIAWRRYWKKDAPDDAPEFYCPDWND